MAPNNRPLSPVAARWVVFAALVGTLIALWGVWRLLGLLWAWLGWA
jgi:hypothetical protein